MRVKMKCNACDFEVIFKVPGEDAEYTACVACGSTDFTKTKV